MFLVKAIIKWALNILSGLVMLGLLICSYSDLINPSFLPEVSYFGMLLPFFIIADIILAIVSLFFNKMQSLFCVGALVVCWSSIRAYCPINLFQGTPEGKTLKLLSYNVYAFGQNTQSTENNEVLDYILESDADIVCLQESWGEYPGPVYDAVCAAYPYVDVDSASRGIRFLARFPIIGRYEIEHNTPSASTKIYELQIDQDTVLVINTHLESYSLTDSDKAEYKHLVKESLKGRHDDGTVDSFLGLKDKLVAATVERSHQVDAIDAFINEQKRKYIILCGDLNDTPVSYAHHVLTRQLSDAYAMSGNGPGWSYNRNGMLFRIDHILVSDSFHPYGAKVDKTTTQSDHYPIFCTLEML